jgi:hypothetical protein
MKRLLALLLALFAFAAAPSVAVADPTGQPVEMFENGFCAGISWITLRSGEAVTADEGPDFRVFRVTGPEGHSWGVYSGNAAQVSYAARRQVARRSGVTLSAVTEDGAFRGYLAANRQGWQNHFFGSVFDGSARDLAFFDRVDFSPAGQAKCESHRGQ